MDRKFKNKKWRNCNILNILQGLIKDKKESQWIWPSAKGKAT